MTDDAFNRWYKNHKKDFNDKRKSRYHTDPEYKKRVLAASRQTREDRRKGVVKSATSQSGVVNLSTLAEDLEISVWTLRNWMANDYFPRPQIEGGGLWFTPWQVALVQLIQFFMKDNNVRRLSAAQRQDLQKVLTYIHAHWGDA